MKKGNVTWALLSTGCAGFALFAQPALAQTADNQSVPQATSLDDIVVTARRREESLQAVPIAIAAFSGETLKTRNVQSIEDVRRLAGGLTFNSEGGANSSVLTLRGIGQIPSGLTTPGVVTYINDAPIPSIGSNLPTYDIANIQVLKGPQGTLFGKNTLGGAVLVNTVQPTGTFEGYAKGSYGRWNYHTIEGAVNLPLGDIAAIRVAGQIRRQDPRVDAIETLQGGPKLPGFGNIHENAFRVSLRLNPSDSIESTTIFDYVRRNQLADPLALSVERYDAPFALFGDLGTFILGPQSTAAAAVQKNYINKAGYDGGINGGYTKLRTWSLSNRTSFQQSDALTFRNIFTYRKTFSSQNINTGATPIFDLAPADPNVLVPFILFHAGADQRLASITEEFQVLGNFDWGDAIAGAFYNQDRPDKGSGNYFTAFGTTLVPFSTTQFKNTSAALFAQAGIHLAEKLKLNLGARYSWDKSEGCGGTFYKGGVPDPTQPRFGSYLATYNQCRDVAASGSTLDGIGYSKTKTSAPTWTVGLDYQVDQDLLLFLTSRRGYRAGGINVPNFETPATTGGKVCGFDPTGAANTLPCPDLRPFQSYGKETLTDAEAGAKWQFQSGLGRGRINLSGWYAKHKNAVQYINISALGIPNGTPDTPDKSSIAANVADFTYYGFDLDFEIRPASNFSVGFNGAITKTKIDRVASVDFGGFSGPVPAPAHISSPTFSGSVNAAWTLPLHPADGDVVISADLFMTADYAGAQGIQLPGYELANARLDWKNIGRRGLDVGVYVRNLFNATYIAGQSVNIPTFPVSSLYYGMPRNLGVDVRFQF